MGTKVTRDMKNIKGNLIKKDSFELVFNPLSGHTSIYRPSLCIESTVEWVVITPPGMKWSTSPETFILHTVCGVYTKYMDSGERCVSCLSEPPENVRTIADIMRV
jgi:hypothetical protein